MVDARLAFLVLQFLLSRYITTFKAISIRAVRPKVWNIHALPTVCWLLPPSS